MDKQNISEERSNKFVEVVVQSDIGDRDQQQDCFSVHLTSEGGVFAVCDGMGGLSNGKHAAEIAAQYFVDNGKTCLESPQNIKDDLCDIVFAIDRKIAQEMEKQHSAESGTTIVGAFIIGRLFYWVSVGDSRLYMFRNNNLYRITQDHNYQYILNNQLENGEITQSKYEEDSQYGDRLVSFLGMNGLTFIDSSSEPLLLLSGDRIFLCSDGLYRYVSDSEIQTILSNIKSNTGAVNALIQKTKRNAKTLKRTNDNITVMLISVL